MLSTCECPLRTFSSAIFCVSWRFDDSNVAARKLSLGFLISLGRALLTLHLLSRVREQTRFQSWSLKHATDMQCLFVQISLQCDISISCPSNPVDHRSHEKPWNQFKRKTCNNKNCSFFPSRDERRETCSKEQNYDLGFAGCFLARTWINNVCFSIGERNAYQAIVASIRKRTQQDNEANSVLLPSKGHRLTHPLWALTWALFFKRFSWGWLSFIRAGRALAKGRACNSLQVRTLQICETDSNPTSFKYLAR